MDDAFKQNLKDYVDIRRQLKEVSADVKLLRNKEKDLCLALKRAMSEAEADEVKSLEMRVKVTHKISVRKPQHSAKALRGLLADFYQGRGDPNTLELLNVYLDENRVEKEMDILSVREL